MIENCEVQDDAQQSDGSQLPMDGRRVVRRQEEVPLAKAESDDSKGDGLRQRWWSQPEYKGCASANNED